MTKSEATEKAISRYVKGGGLTDLARFQLLREFHYG